MCRIQDPENVKMSLVHFVISFLVSGDNIVIRQLMDVKGRSNSLFVTLSRYLSVCLST